MRINDRVLEKIIIWNDMTFKELCDELWYSPQQHNFIYIDDELTKYDNWDYMTITIEDLLKCKHFVYHINLYLQRKFYLERTPL